MQDTAGQVILFITKVFTRSAVVLLLALMVLAILVGETGLGDVSLGGNVKLSTFFGKSALNFTLRAAVRFQAQLHPRAGSVPSPELGAPTAAGGQERRRHSDTKADQTASQGMPLRGITEGGLRRGGDC